MFVRTEQFTMRYDFAALRKRRKKYAGCTEFIYEIEFFCAYAGAKEVHWR